MCYKAEETLALKLQRTTTLGQTACWFEQWIFTKINIRTWHIEFHDYQVIARFRVRCGLHMVCGLFLLTGENAGRMLMPSEGGSHMFTHQAFLQPIFGKLLVGGTSKASTICNHVITCWIHIIHPSLLAATPSTIRLDPHVEETPSLRHF